MLSLREVRAAKIYIDNSLGSSIESAIMKGMDPLIPLKPATTWTRERHMALGAWIFTPCLLLFLFIVAFLIPDPTPGQAALFRFFMALLAAFAGFFFIGNLMMKGTIFRQRYAAGGSVALFMLVEAVANPYAIRSQAGDYFPQFVRPDRQLEDAQAVLKEKGLLSKNPDGVRDTETTKAIREVQAEGQLPQNGALTSATLRAISSRPDVPAEGPPGEVPRIDLPPATVGLSPAAPSASPLPATTDQRPIVRRPEPPQGLRIVPNKSATPHK